MSTESVFYAHITYRLVGFHRRRRWSSCSAEAATVVGMWHLRLHLVYYYDYYCSIRETNFKPIENTTTNTTTNNKKINLNKMKLWHFYNRPLFIITI